VTTYVGLLRGINIGSHKRVAMGDLRDMVESLGFSHVQTLLQSGNVVFRGASRATAKIEAILESAAIERLDVETSFLVRTAREWSSIVAANPFPREAARDPSRLIVTILRAAPGAGKIRALQSVINGPEVVRGKGKQLYVFYPNGMGRSRLTHTSIERRLETTGTARNWNTTLKLEALLTG